MLSLRIGRHPAADRLRGATGTPGCEASLPRLELLTEHRPDALIITHAHSDHIGALAVVKLLYPELPVFMTDATARITLPMLLDAAKVAGRNGSPMFTEADVVKALQQVTTLSPDVPVRDR